MAVTENKAASAVKLSDSTVQVRTPRQKCWKPRGESAGLFEHSFTDAFCYFVLLVLVIWANSEPNPGVEHEAWSQSEAGCLL